MILAPPDFPLPFDAIPILILEQLFPIESPCSGVCFKSLIRIANSFLSEAYFLMRRLPVAQKYQ